MVTRFIRGTPYSRNKSRGRIAGAKEWSVAVQSQTQRLRLVNGPSALDVTFVLPPDRFPEDHPHGNDLDNLLKRLLDALGETVLREAPGKDGSIMELTARKRKALRDEPTGARIRITKYRPTTG
jgi:Holliday junction resolvase RusA-like endonuclease